MITLSEAEEFQQSSQEQAPWYIIQQKMIDEALVKMFPKKESNECSSE